MSRRRRRSLRLAAGFVSAVLAGALVACGLLAWAAPAVAAVATQAAGRADAGEPALTEPIDALRPIRDRLGDARVTLGVDLTPSGLVASVPLVDGLVQYAEATLEAGLRAGVGIGLADGLTLALGWRAGLVYHREAMQGSGPPGGTSPGGDGPGGAIPAGQETTSVTTASLSWTSAAVQYESPRSMDGKAVGLTLRWLVQQRAAGLDVGVSQVRDPVILFGGLSAEAGTGQGGERAVGLVAGATFAANDRFFVKGAASLKLPLGGMQAPASALTFRAAYQLDGRGDAEVAVHGAWSLAGDEPRVTLGVEWTAKVFP